MGPWGERESLSAAAFRHVPETLRLREQIWACEKGSFYYEDASVPDSRNDRVEGAANQGPVPFISATTNISETSEGGEASQDDDPIAACPLSPSSLPIHFNTNLINHRHLHHRRQNHTMRLSSLISAGALALTAEAFLVPFGTKSVSAGEDLSTFDTTHDVSIDCSTCPYAVTAGEDNHREWKKDVPSDLDMTLRVENNLVTFNGVPIFPLQSPGLIPLLTVTQRPTVDADVKSEEVKISYSLEVIAKPANDGNTLFTVTLGPMALENEISAESPALVMECHGLALTCKLFRRLTNPHINKAHFAGDWDYT